MHVWVSNNDEEVFSGPLETFLQDNQEDDEVCECCSKLGTVQSVKFSAFSGDWTIATLKQQRVEICRPIMWGNGGFRSSAHRFEIGIYGCLAILSAEDTEGALHLLAIPLEDETFDACYVTSRERVSIFDTFFGTPVPEMEAM